MTGVRVPRTLAGEAGRGAAAGLRQGTPAYLDHGSREAEAIALTFDDGPGALTAGLLDVLAAGRARATFNVLGSRVRGREELLRRTLREGHEVGSHAEHHERLGGRPLAAYRQLVRTSASLRAATGVAPRVFRAPYGDVSRGVVRAARAAGLTAVGWDVDPRDYETPGADAILERVVAAVRPGSIVLLHDDRRALEQTVTATERILVSLAKRGLRAVTASELLGL
ncbi:MAG TPA: polysaccharide deacetylase family protein [Thermoleophilaceae bacterium]|nr:polysaccharide deacetylase family protein [Thermoleophilaceae bacterium]